MGLKECGEYYALAKRRLKRAIEADECCHYSLAIDQYGLACESFLAGYANDPSPSSRSRVIAAVRDYLSRAEYLAESTRTASKATPSHNSSRKKQSTERADRDAEAQEKKQLFDEKGKQAAEDEGFKGVAGLSKVKQALREAVILPMVHPQAFVGGRKPWKGVLLYGPPGTGKSHVAAALSKEAKCTMIAISASDIMSKHQGDSERAVKKIFEMARKSKPAVIFIDEVDSLGMSRSSMTGSNAEAARRVLNELLKQMDGVGSDMDQVTVVAATNHPSDIDAALRRRFEKRIYVPMPGPRARARILRLSLGSDPSVVRVSARELEAIARKTGGYSGADLAVLANEALMIPIRRCLKATHFKLVPASSLEDSAGLIGGMLRMLGGWASFFADESVLVPCNPSEPGARKMSMLDPKFPSEKLRVPPVTARELEAALVRLKPSVDRTDLQQYVEFASAFGDKLGVKDFEDDEEEEEEEEEEGESERVKRESLRQPSRTREEPTRTLVPS